MNNDKTFAWWEEKWTIWTISYETCKKGERHKLQKGDNFTYLLDP